MVVPTPVYDALVRFKLKPGEEFEFNQESDSIMRVIGPGVRKLVDRRWAMRNAELHISMIPDEMGVVQVAMASMANDGKRPGFWYVVMDTSGRPVAEYPLTYSRREISPEPLDDGKNADQPPSASGAVVPTVETTGDLTRLMVSWLVSSDRVNDFEVSTILEILSVHALSPRNVRLPIKSRSIAQRMHDELLCFEDDVKGIPDAVEQATKLREEIARLFNEGTL